MATDVEIEISSLLIIESNLENVGKQLSERANSPEYNRNEKLTFVNGLIHMGFYKEALSAIVTCYVNHPKHFPWKQLLFLLFKAQIQPSEEWLQVIFEGAKEEKNSEELSAIEEWESWDQRFREVRLKTANQKKKERQKKFKELQDKVKFLRSQRLYDEEIQVLHQIRALYPNYPKITTQLNEIRELWSKEVIFKASTHRTNWLTSTGTHVKRDPELEKQADHLLEFIKENKDLNEGQLYNLALFFKFIESPKQSLKILESLQNFAADWLRIDVYLDSEQYVAALDEISKLEQKYPDNPETSFSAIYARAIALKHLGQTPAAIELMQKITKVKLDYRSARQYIKDWEFS